MRVFFLVLTWARDLHLLLENEDQFHALVDAGHEVAFLSDPGDLVPDSLSFARQIETPARVSYERLPDKCLFGFREALKEQWDWLVKIDSDTLICGDIPEFLAGMGEADAVGWEADFEPALDAIRVAGPPDVPADVLASLGHRYFGGGFYAIQRPALVRAMPVFAGLSPRIVIAEDVAMTASLVATGSSVRLEPLLTFGRSLKAATAVDLRSPVIGLPSRDPAERRFFASRARALFAAGAAERATCSGGVR